MPSVRKNPQNQNWNKLGRELTYRCYRVDHWNTLEAGATLSAEDSRESKIQKFHPVTSILFAVFSNRYQIVINLSNL